MQTHSSAVTFDIVTKCTEAEDLIVANVLRFIHPTYRPGCFIISGKASFVASSRGSYCSRKEAIRHFAFQSPWGPARTKPPVYQSAKAEDKCKSKGCPPRLLLQRFPQARPPQPDFQFVRLKLCVRSAGGSSGPCSGTGEPSWCGWADWAQWSGATHQREAPRCGRWTLERHKRGWISSY